MSAPKFTPGPWHACFDGTAWVEAQEDGFRRWPATDVMERDVYLIAAAPDLYAACEQAEWCLANLTHIFEEAKRRGDYYGCDVLGTVDTLRAALEKAGWEP